GGGPGGRAGGGGGEPAAQRLLPRAQARPAEQGPAVEQQRGRVTRPRPRQRLGAGRGNEEGGLVGNRRKHEVAAGRAHLDPREGPAQFLGGAGGAGDDGAEPVVAAVHTAPTGRQRAAPAAVRRGGRAGQPERSVAVRPADQGDAPGLGGAAAAGDRGEVAAPRHLDEDRAAGLERGPGGAKREAGQPGGGRRLVPAEFAVVCGGADAGSGGAQGRP